jgi:hypothetical protein
MDDGIWTVDGYTLAVSDGNLTASDSTLVVNHSTLMVTGAGHS